MPQKKILIPLPIQLCDPATGVELDHSDAKIDFASFIAKLNANPLWGESWQAAMAQRSIGAALAVAKDSLVISEEDWKFLEAAAKHPKMMLIGQGGSVVVPGLGIHPSMAGQIVPFQLAIINAETV